MKKEFFNKNRKLNILDIGCGDGIMLFEINKILNEFDYTGLDVDKKLIETGIELSVKMAINNKSKFYLIDVDNFENFFIDSTEKYDVILILDVLEHIENPVSFIKSIIGNLKDETYILVSVPTPNYIKMFGKKFHLSVGHKRNGYELDEISELFSEFNLKLNYIKYNTGIISKFGCFLYYRLNFDNRFFLYIKSVILHLFSYLDFFNNKKISCSLFTVYKNSL